MRWCMGPGMAAWLSFTSLSFNSPAAKNVYNVYKGVTRARIKPVHYIKVRIKQKNEGYLIICSCR